MDIARDSRENSNRCLFVYLVFFDKHLSFPAASGYI